MILSVLSTSESVRAMQTCSSQFSPLLRQWGSWRHAPLISVSFWRQWGYANILPSVGWVLDTVGRMNTCSTQFSQLLRQWGHADMLLPVQSAYGDSGASLLLSVRSAFGYSGGQADRLVSVSFWDCGGHADMLHSVSQLLRHWGPRRHARLSSVGFWDSEDHSEILSSVKSGSGNSEGHVDMLLSVQSGSGDSGAHADMLHSLSPLLRHWGPRRHACLSSVGFWILWGWCRKAPVKSVTFQVNGPMQTCSSQFSQLLDTVGKFRHTPLSSVSFWDSGAMQTCSS